jgi:hypothetical protein
MMRASQWLFVLAYGAFCGIAIGAIAIDARFGSANERFALPILLPAVCPIALPF